MVDVNCWSQCVIGRFQSRSQSPRCPFRWTRVKRTLGTRLGHFEVIPRKIGSVLPRIARWGCLWHVLYVFHLLFCSPKKEKNIGFCWKRTESILVAIVNYNWQRTKIFVCLFTPPPVSVKIVMNFHNTKAVRPQNLRKGRPFFNYLYACYVRWAIWLHQASFWNC